MKLGITGLLPNSIGKIDTASLKRVREMGFTGSALPGNEAPSSISTELAREAGKRAAAEGLEFVEYGQYQTTFVDPDATVRRASIDVVREATRVAQAAGCRNVIVGIGSLNPAGQWFADKRNFEPATVERLVSTLREAVKPVEAAGLVLALECHVTTTLRNATVAREVLDAVGSKSLKVHLDPVNWMTFETVFDSGPAISGMFAELGPERISGAHSKGVVCENNLIVHMNETHTGGEGDLLDHHTFLKELAAIPGDPYLVIEHLPVEHMPGARAHLLKVALELALAFVE
jgi:sugar phosphate isomerase/epimerase